MAMRARDRSTVDMLERIYPSLRLGGDPTLAARVLAASVPDLGQGAAADAVRDISEVNWRVLGEALNPSGLGVPAGGGTTFAVSDAAGGAPRISATSGPGYQGYMVQFTSGAATGRRAMIVDVRQSGVLTYITLADEIDVGPGDALVVLPLRALASGGLFTDGSGKIKAAATSQLLFAANLARRYLLVQNPSTAALQGIGAAESLFVNFGTAATVGQPSIEIPAGGEPLILRGDFVEVEAVYVVAATVDHAFAAKEA